MPKIRHFAWACEELDCDPRDYNYISDNEIVEKYRKHTEYGPAAGFISKDLNSILSLMPKSNKQFTIEHLRQLIAARGFTGIMCNHLEPDQIQDKEIRSRVAIIQHLLNEIWEKIDNG